MGGCWRVELATATDAQRREVARQHLRVLQKQKAAQTAQINRLNNQIAPTSLQPGVNRWINFVSQEQLRCVCDVLLEELLKRERLKLRSEEDAKKALSENRDLLQQRGVWARA